MIRSTLWGLYAASSWTWCIGMFLPLALIDRWGWPGALVFAIPNVLGCAAMGYVVGTPHAARRMIERHTAAMAWFSLVTIAFQLFFLGVLLAWLLPVDADRATIAVAVVAGISIVALVVAQLPTRLWPWLGAAVWIASFVFLLRLGLDSFANLPLVGSLSDWSLAWLAPTFVFGFLLCPYLDLTFHRALRESPSRHAFAVFGVAFAIMLLLTVAYSGGVPGVLIVALLTHLLVQGMFTVGAHARELRGVLPRLTWAPRIGVLAIPPVACLLALIALQARTDAFGDMQIYLRFFFFYGAVFPAYVLLFIGPFNTLPPSRRNITRLLVVLVLTMPLYELGFMHALTWLMLPPLAGYLALAMRPGQVARSST